MKATRHKSVDVASAYVQMTGALLNPAHLAAVVTIQGEPSDPESP